MCWTFSGVVYQLVGLVPGATGTAPGAALGTLCCQTWLGTTNPEEQFVDPAVGADIGDVLEILRRRIPAGRTGSRRHRYRTRRVGMSPRLLKFSGGSVDDYAICCSS